MILKNTANVNLLVFVRWNYGWI